MKHYRITKTIAAALLSLACSTANAQQGAWSGDLNVMGTKLPLVFNFSADGCTLDSPAQGAKDIPAQKSVAEDGTIKVTVAMIGATFEGKMEGDCINGTFAQGALQLPLTLKQGKNEVRRPQTPVAPFPYKQEEVSFENAGFHFGGTLCTPANCTGDTPVVLFVTGSGQQNRDEELFGHRPFAVIADALARNGIASLRYDDRGWGDKSIDFSHFTTDDFKQDAAAALQLLRQRFHFTRVGIVGHSEGGTIALMLAAEGKADFIVSLAGMAASGRETLLQQNRLVLQAAGMTPDVVETYCKPIAKALDALAEGKTIEDISDVDVPNEMKPVFKKTLQQGNSPYLRHFLTLNPAALLPKIKCPVLALNGTKDTQVDCTQNLTTLEKGLTNCRHEIKKVEGVNHLFQHFKTGIVMEYQQIEETMAPEVLEIITEWINRIKN